MSELEALCRVERIARDVKLNTHSVLYDKEPACKNCGHAATPRGVQSEVRKLLAKQLRELEGALVELDLVRAGARASP